MKLPNWLKSRTRQQTEEVVKQLAEVRKRLVKRIGELETAISATAQKSGNKDAD